MREKDLTELNSALVKFLKARSNTLKTLYLCHHQSSLSYSELRRRQSHPITFTEMEKLEVLALIGLQISRKSLDNLNSLKTLVLAEIDHRDIVAALGPGHWHYGHPVLEKLTQIMVNDTRAYREVIGRRKDVKLLKWHWQNVYSYRELFRRHVEDQGFHGFWR